jgi:hypothetical protein
LNGSYNHDMKTLVSSVLVGLLALATVAACRAEDPVSGTWKGQFDSQIGLQKYTFILKVDGDKITGKAIGEREMGTNEVVITEGRLGTNEVFFVEPLKFQDNEIRIEYTGKVSGDEIKFHRKVGDFAEEDFTAKRAKDADVKTDDKQSGTNAPPAKP